MGSFWPAIAVIAIFAILVDGVVRIIRAAKSGGSKANAAQLEALEDDLGQLEADLKDARARIEVLEKIVTDGKYDLKSQIDKLADG